jgi:hypothetical protein
MRRACTLNTNADSTERVSVVRAMPELSMRAGRAAKSSPLPTTKGVLNVFLMVWGR